MSSENGFFEDLREWSERKIQIIERYLGGFARILGSQPFPFLYYVDGFAGKGMYGSVSKGSPVRAAELAQEKYPDKLRCIFVEKDDENYSDLISHTETFGPMVKTYHGEFSDHVDTILDRVGQTAILVFLDAFGVKGTEWETTRKIIARTAITDVWIRFDHRTIRRLDGFWNSSSRDARAKIALLCDHFGIYDPLALHKLLDAPTEEGRIQNSVNLYRQRLETVMGSHGFAAAYPIVSLDGVKKYHLFFACKKPKAAILASDVINTVEDDLPVKQAEYAESIRLQKTSGQLSMFCSTPSQNDIFQQKVDELIEAIVCLAKAPSFSPDEIHYALLKNNPDQFGRFRKTHLRKALSELEARGKITMSGAPSNNSTKIIIR